MDNQSQDRELFQFMTACNKRRDGGVKKPSPEEYSCTHILGEKMKNYCNNPEFSDVIIKIGTQQYHAHGFLLSSWSDVLKTMIAEAKLIPGTSSSAKVALHLESSPEMENCVMDQFINFLYTGKIKFWETKDAESLIALAKKYDIKVLTELCEDYLVDSLQEQDLEKAMDIFDKAQELKLDNLMKKVKFALAVNFENIPLPFWKKLSKEIVCEMIGSSFLVATDEAVILDKLVLWIAGIDEEQKMMCLQDMIPKIRFVYMSSGQLQDVENSDCGTLIQKVAPYVLQDAFEKRSLIGEATEVRRQTKGNKISKPVEILKDTDEIPPPRIYWQFVEPGHRLIDDNHEMINLDLNGDMKQPVDTCIILREKDIWKHISYGKWNLRGNLVKMEEFDKEWSVSLELFPNELHQSCKYAAAITINPTDESLQAIPRIGCQMGKVKPEVIEMRLGTGLVGEDQPTSVTVSVAIYVWKDKE